MYRPSFGRPNVTVSLAKTGAPSAIPVAVDAGWDVYRDDSVRETCVDDLDDVLGYS